MSESALNFTEYDLSSYELPNCSPNSSYSRSISTQLLQENGLDDTWEMYKHLNGVKLLDWQNQECINMIKKRKYLLNWGRGMSKTFLLCFIAVFFALLGMKVLYTVPRTDELEQPLQYFNSNWFVDPNSNKKGDKSFTMSISGSKGTWFKVRGKPMIKITNIDDKGYNLSSGRFNVVIYDECALLMYYKKEKELLNKGKGVTRAKDYPKIIYASTPLIGSFFYSMYEKFNDLYISHRNFQNTPINFLVNTRDKWMNITEERREAEEMGILYAWETENLAIASSPDGKAYKNYSHLTFDEFPRRIPTHAGFDFHGWKLGHIYVSFFHNPSYNPKKVWIIDEGAIKYNENDTASDSMVFLDTEYFKMIPNKKGESGGMINDPYIKAGRPYGLSEQNIQGNKKHNLEANLLNYYFIIDKYRCPNIWSDFEQSMWKDANKFILQKETSGDVRRNHYIDALMNAVPKFQSQSVYIPNRKLNFKI